MSVSSFRFNGSVFWCPHHQTQVNIHYTHSIDTHKSHIYLPYAYTYSTSYTRMGCAYLCAYMTSVHICTLLPPWMGIKHKHTNTIRTPLPPRMDSKHTPCIPFTLPFLHEWIQNTTLESIRTLLPPRMNSKDFDSPLWTSPYTPPYTPPCHITHIQNTAIFNNSIIITTRQHH